MRCRLWKAPRVSVIGRGWVITEYADLLVISSSLFLALRSDSLASCRSCFSWSASLALRRMRNMGLLTQGLSPLKWTQYWDLWSINWARNGKKMDAQISRKLSRSLAPNRMAIPACTPIECHILSKEPVYGFEKSHWQRSSCERQIWAFCDDACPHTEFRATL